jgi:hypothetical protein
MIVMITKPKVLKKFCKLINADKELLAADINIGRAIENAIDRLTSVYNGGTRAQEETIHYNDRVYYTDGPRIAALYRSTVIKSRNKSQ